MNQITLREKITKRNWFQATEQRNKRYAKLPKHGKVMELAKDSLFNLINGWTKAKTGTYCTIYPKGAWSMLEETEAMDVRKVLPIMNKTVDCQVCAKGSLFLSAISFKNQMALGTFERAANSGLPRQLRDAFTQKEFDILENLFENDSYLGSGSYCEAFSLETDEQRLAFILVRILQYNGDVTKAFDEKNITKPLNVDQAIVKMSKGYKISRSAAKDLKDTLRGHTVPTEN